MKKVLNRDTEQFIDSYKQYAVIKNRMLLSSHLHLARNLHEFFQHSLDSLNRIMPTLDQAEADLEEARELEENHRSASGNTTRTIREGFLMIKRNRWTEEYCELRNGKFYCYQAGAKFSPERTMVLQLCAVKGPETIPEKEKEKLLAQRLLHNCFQVINPAQNKPIIIQCASETERNLWEHAFLEGISGALDSGVDGKQAKQVDPAVR